MSAHGLREDDRLAMTDTRREPATSADFCPRVLLVDDDAVLQQGLKAILELNGFVCRTAEDGFDALRHLRATPPEIIISDLRMPNMSGFELLAIIRRRFPQIAVIVLSGEFIVDAENSGLLMNAFFRKGDYSPTQLIATMRDLYSQCPMRPALPKPDRAPLWISCRSREYLLATCTECLRSFPIENHEPASEALQTSECPSCGTTITYAVDSSVLKMLASQRPPIQA
jgi:CheY-like chemotaxis protein